MKNHKGLTLIELIAVLVILGVISSIAVFMISNTIQNARLKADRMTVSSINSALSYYNINNPGHPAEELGLSEEAFIKLLVDEGYLSNIPVIQSSETVIEWNSEIESFSIVVDGDLIPLSPFGNTFEEITPEFISEIQDYYSENDSYPRRWGDYKYTDLGLNPEDWEEPILHIIYQPSGYKLRIEPEDGYEFVVENFEGDVITIKSRLNWDIIYNDLDGLWYYKSIDDKYKIDISTLVVQLTT